jgi:phospholipase D1/2
MGLENKVVECLAERITRAAKSNDRNFKVIIVMPLLPGFEGNIADPASTVLRIQVHHQFQAILRNK